MSPEELHILRRRLGLTQAEFAERLGVSTSLITSIEVGRRVFSEPLQQEVMRVFGGRVSVRNSVQARPSSSQRGVFSRGISPGRPGISATGDEEKRFVQQPRQVPAAGPIVDFDRCEWPGCGELTPVDMRYCAGHMALAMIEGRPTRRDASTMTGPLHTDFVGQHNVASQRRVDSFDARPGALTDMLMRFDRPRR